MTEEHTDTPLVGSTGTGSVNPIDEDGDPFTVVFDFRIGVGGLEVLTVRAWSEGGKRLSPAVLADIGSRTQEWAEAWFASAYSRYQEQHLGAGTLRIGTGEDAVSVQAENVKVRRMADVPNADRESQTVAALQQHRRQRDSLSNEERLRAVAAAYMQAPDRQRLKAVMDTLSMSRAQASRYIKAAKDKGMIPTAPKER